MMLDKLGKVIYEVNSYSIKVQETENNGGNHTQNHLK